MGDERKMDGGRDMGFGREGLLKHSRGSSRSVAIANCYWHCEKRVVELVR